MRMAELSGFSSGCKKTHNKNRHGRKTAEINKSEMKWKAAGPLILLLEAWGQRWTTGFLIIRK